MWILANLAPPSGILSAHFFVGNILLSRSDISMPSPLLNIFNFCSVFKSVVEGGFSQGVRADAARAGSLNLNTSEARIFLYDVEH